MRKLLVLLLLAIALSSSVTAVRTTIFEDTFDAEGADWATWAACGSGICATGGNLQADGGGASYFLTKQSNVDLSTCNAGTARLNLTGIAEGGNLEATDCIKVWFSANSGSAYTNETTVLCDDNPASTLVVDFNDAFEVSTMRFRFEGENFDAAGESGSVGYADVYCDVTPADSCTPTAGQNWNIVASDNCVITNQVYNVKNITISGAAGSVTFVNSNVTATGCNIVPNSGASIWVAMTQGSWMANGC